MRGLLPALATACREARLDSVLIRRINDRADQTLGPRRTTFTGRATPRRSPLPFFLLDGGSPNRPAPPRRFGRTGLPRSGLGPVTGLPRSMRTACFWASLAIPAHVANWVAPLLSSIKGNTCPTPDQANTPNGFLRVPLPARLKGLVGHKANQATVPLWPLRPKGRTGQVRGNL
jgi:hypothetical protein